MTSMIKGENILTQSNLSISTVDPMCHTHGDAYPEVTNQQYTVVQLAPPIRTTDAVLTHVAYEISIGWRKSTSTLWIRYRYLVHKHNTQQQQNK